MIHPLVEMPQPVMVDMIVATITGLDVAEDRLFARAIQCRGIREHIMRRGIKIQTAIIVAMDLTIVQHQMPSATAVEMLQRIMQGIGILQATRMVTQQPISMVLNVTLVQ
jgi:hypothetical protein